MIARDRDRSAEAVWDAYARFFVLEEGTVYPEDRREMEFYRTIRDLLPGRCLELGAGAGRLARALLGERGITVGLEPSAAMLDLWRSGDIRLSGRVRGRAEELPFDSSVFDLVVFPYNGLQCITDRGCRLDALREAARVLSPGGRLILEICPFFGTRPLERDRHRYTFQGREMTVTLFESIGRDQDRGVTIYDMRYRVEGEPEARIVLEVSIIEPEQLSSDISLCGMSTISTWGDYDMRPYVRGTSPRLILAASVPDPS
ncbi:class I SAM-dependent methyltransferase [Candidatus Fermentibacterales bacterium]|nr:class I SAM-dependent methyltransferase [Candidatus Fermentibacterales bacterium]